jgi:hypothetical protein
MRTYLVVLAVLSMALPSQSNAALSVPDALKDWQGWVLKGEEFRRCPYLSSSAPGAQQSHRCTWPGRLTLDLSAKDGTFSQSWQVFADAWVVLPGNLEYWPRNLQLDGTAAAAVSRNGLPQLRLAPGSHSLRGQFAWNTRPESLPIASQTALVDLKLDGKSVGQPERPGGALWLGQRRALEERQSLQIQVYRLLHDEIPARLETQIQLQVSGAGREELLSVALPTGYTSLSLEGDLPARIEPDGRLRVQLRPGSFQLNLQARGTTVADTLQRPAITGTWAKDEVWSFAGVDRLRVAAVEGAQGIDPAQANVPDEWREFPAFLLADGGSIKLVERSRGLANLDDNQLQLHRDLWLDFNHNGYTVVDHINGTLHRDWRLDMGTPFDLQSARADEDTLLVTQGTLPATAGIELRNSNVNLTATARLLQRGSLPATGWSTRFDNVNGTLHLPPGHRLLGVRGADEVPGSWISGWGLWNLFGVLIVVVFAYWVAGLVPAALAALALLLLHQESPQMIWLWANVLGAMALARAAPEGRLRAFAARYRLLGFAVLGLALLPLLIGQLRLALYPQLEYSAAPNLSSVIRQDASKIVVADVATEAMAASAPPPVMELPATAPLRADRGALDEISVTASRVEQRYATGTLLNAGPGVPNWHYHDYDYSWSGPVDTSQTVQFVYLGRWAMAFWRVIGVALTLALLLLLADTSFNLNWACIKRWLPRRGVTAAALLAIASLFATPHAHAQATPTPELLNELKARLTEQPLCTPSCAEITSAEVVANDNQLRVTLKVSALSTVAVALPHASDRWTYDNVIADGKPGLTVGREADGSVWMPLTPGTHVIVLSGRLASADSIQLSFLQPPRVIAVTSTGWDNAGVSNGRLVSGSVELTRRRRAGDHSVSSLAASEFPAFVRVTRAFNLNLEWSVATRVERIAPTSAAFQVEVPLIAGESLLTDGLEVHDGNRILVGMARGQHQADWNSTLGRSETLELTSPATAARSEHWTFAVNPQWHVEFSGLPASLPEDAEISDGDWVYHYYPRPGETLKVGVTRPAAIAGQTLAIDSVTHESQFGKRSVTGTLTLSYRSTQGGRHIVKFPEAARVTAVTVDDEPLPLRPEKGVLQLSLLPGQHTVGVTWTEARGATLITRPARIDLGTTASNITTTVNLPADRWPLFVAGSGVGPAVLYWGELIVFLALAWGLGRLPQSPLKSRDWLLLGLGLSTLSWFVFLGVVVWMLALRWRAHWEHQSVARWPFNVVQLLLAALSAGVVGTLVFSGIRYGLLASPDMSIAGPGSYYGSFQWFNDRSATVLSQPLVLSVPIWIYKTLMFAWALWIAMALARWLRLAWQSWSSGGIWRGKVLTSK